MIEHLQESGDTIELDHTDLLRDHTGKWNKNTTETQHKVAGNLLQAKGWKTTGDKGVYTHPDMPGHSIRVTPGKPASPWHNDTGKHDVAWSHAQGTGDGVKVTKSGKGVGALRQHVETAESR